MRFALLALRLFGSRRGFLLYSLEAFPRVDDLVSAIHAGHARGAVAQMNSARLRVFGYGNIFKRVMSAPLLLPRLAVLLNWEH